MSNTSTATTATVKTANRRRKSWRNFTDEERAAYREERNAKRKAILDGIAKFTPEDRRKILKAMGTVGTCEGRNLSEVNTIMCFYQRGGTIGADGVKRIDLSIVGGVQQWRKAGRRIKKGEHGMSIWFPRFKKAGSNEGANETALAIPSEILDADGNVKESVNFSLATVFDISQTVPLAEPDEMPRQIECGEVIEVEAVAV